MNHRVTGWFNGYTVEAGVGARVMPKSSVAAALFDDQAVGGRAVAGYRQLRVVKAFSVEFFAQNTAEFVIANCRVGDNHSAEVG
jgi:hypothetical protein